ncbi:hypothetical protein CHARACLAT_026507 [Characodon lateralis]|uniref:Uncharacterized protein n=1 Tax=Characodon lateralis TaxID=208331 RepID=A0ABU7E5N3_9TELE|nr:hypothetical protein [Characodon lateralis]
MHICVLCVRMSVPQAHSFRRTPVKSKTQRVYGRAHTHTSRRHSRAKNSRPTIDIQCYTPCLAIVAGKSGDHESRKLSQQALKLITHGKHVSKRPMAGTPKCTGIGFKKHSIDKSTISNKH